MAVDARLFVIFFLSLHPPNEGVYWSRFIEFILDPFVGFPASLLNMGQITKAQNNLGANYYHGRGVKQDYKEALKWYRLAAEQGFAAGQDNLGASYYHGHGVKQDYKKAVKWFRLAAEQGFFLAQNNLGLMYATGQGIAQDMVQAYKWFNLAAINGHPQAARNRGTAETNMTPSQIAKAQKLAKEWMEKQK